MTALASAVRAWPPTLAIKGLGLGGVKPIELVPITMADGPRDMGVLETVMGGAPGVRVVPAMEIPLVRGTTG